MFIYILSYIVNYSHNLVVDVPARDGLSYTSDTRTVRSPIDTRAGAASMFNQNDTHDKITISMEGMYTWMTKNPMSLRRINLISLQGKAPNSIAANVFRSGIHNKYIYIYIYIFIYLYKYICIYVYIYIYI